MDEVDIALTIELVKNSRTPYRELADRMGLSMNAVHRRIQSMLDIGILQGFVANLSLPYLRPVVTLIHGCSQDSSSSDVIARLGVDDRTFKILLSGMNHLYVHGLLRDVSDLDDYTRFVRKEGMIVDPTVMIALLPRALVPEEVRLSKLDYRIVNALHSDSRRPLTDVSDELGVSARTVRRRLSKMEREGSVELTARMMPTASSDILGFFHVTLKEGVDRSDAMARVTNNYRPNVLSIAPLSDHPDFFFVNVWTKTMRDLRDIRERFLEEDIFRSVIVDILFEGYFFDTWREEELRRKASH